MLLKEVDLEEEEGRDLKAPREVLNGCAPTNDHPIYCTPFISTMYQVGVLKPLQSHLVGRGRKGERLSRSVWGYMLSRSYAHVPSTDRLDARNPRWGSEGLASLAGHT